MLRFMRGWVRIRVTGASPERFFNLCRNHGIVFWNVETDREGICCSMYEEDYRRCGPFAEKSCTTAACMGQYGLKMFLLRYRHRQVFLVTSLLFLALLGISSTFIWDIRLDNNRYYTNDQILSCLKESGIQIGIRKGTVDCERIEQMLRNRFERISWSAVSVEGTILCIEIAENYGPLVAASADASPMDLTAETDGIVDSLVVRKGIAQVNPGDTVTQGQVLVSGSIPRHNDEEEITGYEFVHADADVTLRISISYEEVLEPEMEKKQYAGTRGSRYHIIFGTHHLVIPSLFLLIRSAADQIRPGQWNSDPVFIGSGFTEIEIPVPGFYLYCYREEETVSETSTLWLCESQAEEILENRMNRYLENLQKNGDVIVENTVRIYYDSLIGYEARGMITLLRLQNSYQTIDDRIYEE